MLPETCSVGVVIATKDRADAMKTIALPGLDRSTFRDFVCVVWDASENDATREIVENGDWSFPVFYEKAPRRGSSSQRNDAVRHVRQRWPEVRYVVFIDDDTELSQDALEGVWTSFQNPEVWGVNIPFVQDPYTSSGLRRFYHALFRPWLKASGRGVLEPCLYFYIVPPEIKGSEVDWTVGCGMAFRMDIFDKAAVFFPEAFQRFGGYAAYEDHALSFHLKKRLKHKIVNSIHGGHIHHRAPGGRADVKNLFAARWFNSGLLFDDIYGECNLFSYALRWIAFRTFYLGYFTYHALRIRNLDVFRGLCAGSCALKREKKKIAGNLFKYGLEK